MQNGNTTPAPTFQRATKKQAKLRLALEGPAGYGKTYTALTVATGLVDEGQRIAFIDTEAHSGSLYADRFDFDVIELAPPFHPRRFVEAIHAAEEAGYGALIVDSLSHAWSGDGGTLDIVDELAKTKYKGDSHAAWRDGTTIQQELVDALLWARLHVIAAMRTKTDYVREEVERDGRMRTVIRKQGMKTIQRDELDYEFSIVGRFDTPAVLTIIKSRDAALPPETVINKPGATFAQQLRAWLGSGEAAMSVETGKRIDTLLTGAAIATDQALYNTAVALLKGWGYATRGEFLRTGTEARAQQILAILTPKDVVAGEQRELVPA